MKTRRNSRCGVDDSNSSITDASSEIDTQTLSKEEMESSNYEKEHYMIHSAIEASASAGSDKENGENNENSTSIPLLRQDATANMMDPHNNVNNNDDLEKDMMEKNGNNDSNHQGDSDYGNIWPETPELEFQIPRIAFSSTRNETITSETYYNTSGNYGYEDDAQTLSPSSPAAGPLTKTISQKIPSKRSASTLYSNEKSKFQRMDDDVHSLQTSWALVDNKVKSITQLAYQVNAEADQKESRAATKQQQLVECQAMMQEDHDTQLSRIQFLYDQCSALYNQIQNQDTELADMADENKSLHNNILTLSDEKRSDHQKIHHLRRQLEYKEELISTESKRCEQLLGSLSEESRERKREKLKRESLEEDQAKAQVTLRNLKRRLKKMKSPIEQCQGVIDPLKEQIRSTRTLIQKEILSCCDTFEQATAAFKTLSEFRKKAVSELESTKDNLSQLQFKLTEHEATSKTNAKEIVRLQEYSERQSKRIQNMSASEAMKDTSIRQLKEERDLLLDETKQLRERLFSLSSPKPRRKAYEECQISTETKERNIISRRGDTSGLVLVHLASGQEIVLSPDQTVYLGRVLLATHDIFIKNAHISRHHVSVTVDTEDTSKIMVSHCARNCSYLLRESLVTELQLIKDTTLRKHTEDSDVIAKIFDRGDISNDYNKRIQVLRDRGLQLSASVGDIVLLQACDDAAFLVVRRDTHNS